MFCNTNRGTRRRLAAAGFTFIEVMVVVVIIGMLAGAVTLKVRDHMQTARVNRARADIRVIVEAVEAYSLNHAGAYPTSSAGLEDVQVDVGKDPWGQPYQYNRPGANGEQFEVFSLGADGQPGGDDEDADIYSWQLKDDQ
ncbi:MAG: type II secretion system protein GspG [Phycisphaerae bacterium]